MGNIHAVFSKVAEKVYSNTRFVTELDDMRRPVGHGFRYEETSNGSIELLNAESENKNYFFDKDRFSLQHNGVIWNKKGDNVEEAGLTYRINTKNSDIFKVVNDYLSAHKGKYAIDCASFASLTLITTLLITFKDKLNIDLLSRQEAVVSAAILYTRDTVHKSLNKHLPFIKVGEKDADLTCADKSDLVILKSQTGSPADDIDRVAMHALLVKRPGRKGAEMQFYNPQKYPDGDNYISNGLPFGHVHRIFRLDVKRFLELFSA